MKRLLALAFGTALTASGCIVEVTYDPFVSPDFAMQGDWTINGGPATTATCGPITDVRVILWDAGTFYDYSQLTFPCDGGHFATGRIFQWGSYETQWQAIDRTRSGSDASCLQPVSQEFGVCIIGQSNREALVVNAGTVLADLRDIDFLLTAPVLDGVLTVNVFWEDKPPSTAVFQCGDPRAPARLSYTLQSGPNVASEMLDVPCAPGFDFNDLPFGTYDLTVTGFMSGTGRTDWSGSGTITHAIDGNAFDFDVPYVGP